MSERRGWLERLAIGLEGSDCEVLHHEATYPGQLLVRTLGGTEERFTLYLQPLERARGKRREQFQIWLPPLRLAPVAPYGEPLVIGYAEDLDVFAAWPDARPRRWRRRRLSVSRVTLLDATENGFARAEGTAAFRPGSAWLYLATREERPSRSPAPEGARRYRGLPRLRRRRMRGEEQRAEGHADYRIRREEGDWETLGRGESAEELEPEVDAADDLAASAPEDDEAASAAPSAGMPAGAPMSPPPPPPPPADRPAREIETGFVAAEHPDAPLSPQAPLLPAGEYFFWFGIGADTGASMETTPTPPPADLPDHARLTVQLFPFDGELELVGPTRGEVELMPDGRAQVSRPAALADDGTAPSSPLLFFGVRTGEQPGLQRLRCSLYYGSTLLQSRLVSCRVGGEADPQRPALAADLDYALATSLDLESLEQVPAHDLSLTINGGDGPVAATSHQFRFFSAGEEDPLVANASLEAGEIKRAIEAARGALRKASWETEAEWVDGRDSYRYEHNPGDADAFAQDLITMALRGHRLYVSITRELSEGGPTRAALQEAMLKPGRIQIASAGARLYVPAALFYDQPLESAAGPESEGRFRLCEEFLAALDGAAPLEEARCLKDGCPNREERHVVCPSGFWGYRHEIGWPVGSKKPMTRVELDGEPELAIGVSTDTRLKQREEHIARVLAMGTGSVAESRDAFRDLVKTASPHLVYLYCHGGITAAEKVPFLVLGPPDSDGIDSAYLVDEAIAWGNPPPRPLVFINGCHTTALGPEELGDLVGGFVKDANAIGVVGTEVTVFEPLAQAFAEDMLAGFLDEGMTVGAAIRRARFDLLRARNPLGLVYVPFVAADTRLVSKEEAAA
jgi:hypothetical protein